jgi:hypothetical protein
MGKGEEKRRKEKGASAMELTPCKKLPIKRLRLPRRSVFAPGSIGIVAIPFGCLLCFLCSIVAVAAAAAADSDCGCGERLGGCWGKGRWQVDGEQAAKYVFQGGSKIEGEGEGEEELQRKWGFEVSFLLLLLPFFFFFLFKGAWPLPLLVGWSLDSVCEAAEDTSSLRWGTCSSLSSSSGSLLQPAWLS